MSLREMRKRVGYSIYHYYFRYYARFVYSVVTGRKYDNVFIHITRYQYQLSNPVAIRRCYYLPGCPMSMRHGWFSLNDKFLIDRLFKNSEWIRTNIIHRIILWKVGS